MTGSEALADERVRQLTREILSRSEYASWREVDLDSIPMLKALQDMLSAISETLASMLTTNPYLYWALLYGLAAIAVLLIAHMVWTIRVALRAGAPEERIAGSSRGVDLVACGEELAAQGRFLDAAHSLQLACIEQLLRRRLITLSRSEPNRTLRQRLVGSTLPLTEQAQLIRLLDRTETAWFRDRSHDPLLFESWQQLHRQLSSLPASS